MSNQSGEFDKMPVDEAIKFLDEYSEQVECEKCPVESFDCVEHGCPLVRSVNAIKTGTFVNVTEEELEILKQICVIITAPKEKNGQGIRMILLRKSA